MISVSEKSLVVVFFRFFNERSNMLMLLYEERGVACMYSNKSSTFFRIQI
jgi:hypothetical protein